MTRAYLCPCCKKTSAPREENPAFPFCSARCRTIDLGAWLDERYRVEAEPVSHDSLGEKSN